MLILVTTADVRRFVHSSDADVDVELPPHVDDDGASHAAEPRWVSVDAVAELDGSIALGATVVSVCPLNGVDYYRTQALMPTSAGDVAAYGAAIVETCKAGVAKVEGFNGDAAALVDTLRADMLDELAAIIIRASRGRAV